MNEIGFLKVDRSILSFRWYKNINTFKLFMHLLLTANFTRSVFESHTIERGQVVTGLKKLSADTGLSIQKVRTALNHLKSTNDITIETTTKYSIITIKNYEFYQDSSSTSTLDQQSTNKQLTNEQQQYKKEKNIKNIKNFKNRKFTNSLKYSNYDTDILRSYSIDDFDSKTMFTD